MRTNLFGHGDFLFHFDFVFLFFTLEHEAISFQPTFLKLWVIWIHASLGIVVSFRLLKFGYTYYCFKNLLMGKKKKLKTFMGIEKIINYHICVKAYEKCIAHYLQVSQVIPLLPSVVVNVYIVIFSLITILVLTSSCSL
jgi:hypothetical protein